MPTPTVRPHPVPANGAGAGTRAAMWLNTDRVLYLGLLGAPSQRTLGGHAVYVSLTLPHRISVGGGAWQAGGLSVVPPYVSHRIVGDERMIGKLLVEADTVAPAGLPAFLRESRGALDALRQGSRQYAGSAEFDTAFFGAPLARRPLEARIATVHERVKREPNAPHTAKDCAVLAHVSVLRFLHLFKAVVGVPFRSFRTWQRARSVLYFVTQTASLTAIALDVGYPDSTHFNHSIRNVFGLTPKSMFAGCRRLGLSGGAASC